MAIRIATIVSFRTFEKWKQGIWESDLSTASIGGLARANSFKQPSARKQKVKPVEAAAVEFIRARRIALIELVLGRKLLFELPVDVLRQQDIGPDKRLDNIWAYKMCPKCRYLTIYGLIWWDWTGIVTA